MLQDFHSALLETAKFLFLLIININLFEKTIYIHFIQNFIKNIISIDKYLIFTLFYLIRLIFKKKDYLKIQKKTKKLLYKRIFIRYSYYSIKYVY